MRNPEYQFTDTSIEFLIALALFLLVCLLMNTLSSCSMLAQSIGSAVSGSTYPSKDEDMLGTEADYAAKEAELQAELDNMESLHPGYDEYRYNLDPIGHNPHELAAYLSALLHEYTPQSAAAQLQRVFDLQYGQYDQQRCAEPSESYQHKIPPDPRNDYP